MRRQLGRLVIERENNVLRVDFGRDPDPPDFPGASGLREIVDEGTSGTESISAVALSAALSNFSDIDSGQCNFFRSMYGDRCANLTRGVGHG